MAKNYRRQTLSRLGKDSSKSSILKGLITLAAIAAAPCAISQSVPFDRLYGNGDSNNYYLGHYPVAGTDGLDIHWYGGVRIGTNAGTALQVTDTGIGVGTSAPQARLDVAGGVNLANSFPLQLSGADINHGLKYKRNYADNTLLDGPYLYGYYGGSLGIKQGSAETHVLNWNTTGNVGIGTNQPTHRLTAYTAAMNTGADQQYPFFASVNGYGVALGYDTASDAAIINSVQTGQQWKNLAFETVAGNVGIGTVTPQAKLDVAGKSSFRDNVRVDGKLEAKELKVTTTPTADFVFDRDYRLPDLGDTEKYLAQKHHLPEIPSAAEMAKDGVNLGEFQIKLLQKIEELTLYVISQQKQLKQQQVDIQKLKQDGDFRP